MIQLFQNVYQLDADRSESGASLQRSELMPRVTSGAAWLDVKHPGWFNEINRGDLDLGSCDGCVMGQLYQDYNAIQDYLAATEPSIDLVALGLDLADGDRSDANWNTLTNCWRTVISERLRWLRESAQRKHATVTA